MHEICALAYKTCYSISAKSEVQEVYIKNVDGCMQCQKQNNKVEKGNS